MLVMDDAKAKLLKMKERLLQVAHDDTVISEYQRLAQELDRETYDNFVEAIKNTNYNDFPLDEQLRMLNQVVSEYDTFVLLQCEYKNVYEMHTGEELELSDLGTILIDNIKKRISDLEGYLYNQECLDKGKEELEKLNLSLIEADKKREYVESKSSFLEDELLNNFLNAEGRTSLGSEEIGYASIVDEYRDNDIDIKELVKDPSLLESKIVEVDRERQANEEKAVAAQICYENAPTDENEDVYDAIKMDVVKSRYLLVLYRLANIISRRANKYYEMVEKRKQIKYLNTIRINCLSSMGISFIIDPFSRLKVNDQLNTLNSFEYDPEEIRLLRRKISNLTEVIESRSERDSEFRSALAEPVSFVKTDNEPIVIPEDIVVDEEIDDEKAVLENQVIAISAFLYPEMIPRIKEKANGVVKRVYELFDTVPEVRTYNPELVVEELPEELVSEDEMPVFEDEKSEPFPEEIDDELFEEIKPFEEAPLFSDRYETDIFDGNTNNKHETSPENVGDKTEEIVENPAEPTLPDVFWVTQEDHSDGDNVLSFDEQVDALVGDNKTKKLVA